MQILLYICNMGRSYFLMTEKEEWRKKKESASPSGEEKEDEGRGIAAVTSVWTTRQLTHVCSFLYRIYSQRFVGWTYRNQLFATGAYDSNSSIAVSFLFPSLPSKKGRTWTTLCCCSPSLQCIFMTIIFIFVHIINMLFWGSRVSSVVLQGFHWYCRTHPILAQTQG